MKNSYSVEIDAAPERVFFWLDDAERVMQWLPNVVENEDLQVTPERVGSTFRQVYLENGQRMEMRGEVTGYERNRRLTSNIQGDVFGLYVDYQLEDLSGGRTRLTQHSDVTFNSVFMKIMGSIMCFFTRKSAQRSLEESFGKLKELAETGSEEVRR